MPRTITLGTLVTRVRQRADIIGMDATLGFIPDLEIKGYLDAALTELWELLASKKLLFHFNTSTITGTGAATYNLPADFYGVIGLDYQLSSGIWVPLREISFDERYDFMGTASRALAYMVRGEATDGVGDAVPVVELFPTPSSGTYKLSYIPAPSDISAAIDGSVINGVLGYEEFLILHAAIKCMQKEESDSKHLMMQLEQQRARIEAHAEDRIKGPQRVIDIESRNKVYDAADWYPYI
jgi:hypothetical protein